MCLSGKLQQAIDTARESLSNHMSYQIVLRAEQQKKPCSPCQDDYCMCTNSGNSDLFGSYGDVSYEKLLPEIEMVKSITFDGWKRRELLSKNCLSKRIPMPCIDRTLCTSQFFSTAKKLVDEERDLLNSGKVSKRSRCTRPHGTTPISTTPLETNNSKLPALFGTY